MTRGNESPESLLGFLLRTFEYFLLLFFLSFIRTLLFLHRTPPRHTVSVRLRIIIIKYIIEYYRTRCGALKKKKSDKPRKKESKEKKRGRREKQLGAEEDGDENEEVAAPSELCGHRVSQLWPPFSVFNFSPCRFQFASRTGLVDIR